MAENREYLTRAEENGSINIAEDVVAAIAATETPTLCRSIPGFVATTTPARSRKAFIPAVTSAE